MHSSIRRITRALLAAAAGIALSTAAVSGASASAAAPQAARVFSAAVSHAAPSPGTQLWVKRYNGPASINNQANSVAVSPTGNAVFVTGESVEAGGVTFTYATIAYNATTGAQLWAKRYSSGFDTADIANAVAVSPDGGTVFVTGQGTTGYATVAYNAATGAQLWVKTHRTGVAYSVAVSPTGNEVFVTGQDGFLDYATVAYNATTGAQLWVKRYISPAVGARANAVAVSPDGGTVFVTGYSDGTSSGEDYATVAYNAATGAQLWVKRYNGLAGNNTDDAHSIAVSPDSKTVFVSGESYGSAHEEGYATIAYNAATGAQLWIKRYDGTANSFAQAFSVAVSPTGKTVFVTGNDGSISWTVAYSAATGTQLWAKAYSGTSPGGGGAMSAGVSPDGTKVYITGFVGDIGKNGYGTVAYNAVTGTQLWAKKYFGPGGDSSAVDLAVSPTSGTVFVTGSSVNGAAFDYATVAYAG